MEVRVLRFDASLGHYAFIEAGLETALHAHPSLEIVTWKSGSVVVRGQRLSGPGDAVAVLPNEPHAFAAASGECRIDMFDLEKLVPGASVDSTVRTLMNCLAEAQGGLPPECRERVAATIRRARSSDPRVGKVLRRLDQLEIASTTPVEDLASLAGLSASRLSKVFKDTVGISLKRYLVYRRLRSAVAEQQARGCSLTEAAHAARFTDLAHLSRQFRSFFGIMPSLTYRPSGSVQAKSRGRD